MPYLNADQILNAIEAEYKYWRDHTDDKNEGVAWQAMGAVGACANLLAVGRGLMPPRDERGVGQQIIDGLPDYDRFIIESITETLRNWIDKQRHNVVWLHKEDIDQLETWAKDLAKKYRDTELHAGVIDAEAMQQPNDGWTPAEPWTRRTVSTPVKSGDQNA